MQREAERSQSDLVDGVLEAYSERQVGKKAKREDYENDDVEWEEVPSAGLVVFSTTFCYYTYMCPSIYNIYNNACFKCQFGKKAK